MTGHTYSVFAIVCTVQDGRPVAVTGSQDGTVRIRDLTAGRCIDRIPLPTPCTALAWGSTDHLFVAFDRDVAVLRRKPYGRNEGPVRRTGIVRVSRASGQDGP
ncbi:hypothetical protein [Embleya sp. NPDC005971]|uniref:hypothetical protein n=1 Tax=Embleya sp. NPDC005971 TaxID=3156724 RepID=UPI0033DC88D2